MAIANFSGKLRESLDKHTGIHVRPAAVFKLLFELRVFLHESIGTSFGESSEVFHAFTKIGVFHRFAQVVERLEDRRLEGDFSSFGGVAHSAWCVCLRVSTRAKIRKLTLRHSKFGWKQRLEVLFTKVLLRLTDRYITAPNKDLLLAECKGLIKERSRQTNGIRYTANHGLRNSDVIFFGAFGPDRRP